MEPRDHKSLREASNTGMWLESRIHTIFTEMADDLYGNGYLTREERKALSAAIGNALDAFTKTIEAEAKQLYQRRRWDEPEAQPMMAVEESGSEDGLLAKLMKLLRLNSEARKDISEATTVELSEFAALIEDSSEK